MCKTVDNKYKLSFSEMISASGTGKTSATGTIGVLLCLLSMIMILFTFIFYFLNLEEAHNIMMFIDKSIIILGIGAALLGARKVTGAVSSIKGSNAVQHAEELVEIKNK